MALHNSRSSQDESEPSKDFPSLSDVSLHWMGGEPSKYDHKLEQQGVSSILKALTDAERDEIIAFDMTVPIRHLRAEKVCFKFHVFKLFCIVPNSIAQFLVFSVSFHSQGDVVKAVAQIKKTLSWRKEFGVDVIVKCFAVANTEHDSKDHRMMREILSEENRTGKIYTRGYDQEGRALFYMTPARENTNVELNNMRHLVWSLEKAIACTARRSVEIGMSKKPLEKINLLIDYDAFKLSNAPPMSTTKYTLEILQKHYPERMKHAYLLNPPLVFRAFWALIKSFVDPITKEKIVFCSGIEGRAKLTNNVTEKHKLEVRSYGSDSDIRDFDSSEYVSLPFHVGFDE